MTMLYIDEQALMCSLRSPFTGLGVEYIDVNHVYLRGPAKMNPKRNHDRCRAG